ncbi:uncharacterized protein TNCV_659711 [Trichonephila clavipes]|nr:uncharacterized protein TNCV_659711 [Trichonephila clavipes]
MKRAIWATYFHKAPTDAYPQHGLCSTDEDIWCEYNRAITTGEVYKHKNTLPSEVLNCIKNVYRELSIPNLLAECLPARAMETADWERLRKANYDILQNSKEARVKKSAFAGLGKEGTLGIICHMAKNSTIYVKECFDPFDLAFSRLVGLATFQTSRGEMTVVHGMIEFVTLKALGDPFAFKKPPTLTVR